MQIADEVIGIWRRGHDCSVNGIRAFVVLLTALVGIFPESRFNNSRRLALGEQIYERAVTSNPTGIMKQSPDAATPVFADNPCNVLDAELLKSR